MQSFPQDLSLPIRVIRKVVGTCACALALVAIACTSGAAPPDVITCEDPRPQMCTREYMPVCALRDTGVRCVTTPCPSTEQAEYANGCEACSDPKVIEWRTGSCPAPQPEPNAPEGPPKAER